MKSWMIWVIVGVAIVMATGGGVLLATQLKKPEGEVCEIPSPESNEREVALRKIKMAVTSGLALPPSDVRLTKASQGPQGWEVEIAGKSEIAELPTVLAATKKVFAELKRTGVTITEAKLLLRTDAWRDVYGRTMKDTDMLRIVLGGDTFQRIDWAGFDPMDFPQVATEF